MNHELRTTVNMQLETVSTKSEQVRKITYEIIKPFLQNEPNFQKSQMNVTDLLTREYEKKDTWWSGKNEPKTNPNEPNSNPKQSQFKPKQTQFPIILVSLSWICIISFYIMVT
jgi:hypothetical protein